MTRYRERIDMSAWFQKTAPTVSELADLFDFTELEDDENPLAPQAEFALELANIAGLIKHPAGWIDADGTIYTQEEALTLYDECLLTSSQNS